MKFSSALAALVLIVGYPAIVSAACSDPNQQSCSSSYGVSETFFGTGGQLCVPGSSGNSANYCAKSSVGELGVGNTLGTAYQAQAGFNTNREPSIAVLVNDSRCPDYNAVSGASRNLVLNTGAAQTTSVNFSAMSYLASGYVVQTVGQAPTYAGGPHTLFTPGYFTSSPGTEQFGINLVHNTSPAVGNDPTQYPDVTFGFGGAATGNGTTTNYGSPNHFNYNNSDTIASSLKSSGVTCYDISYLFNISNVTPAGTYVFNQSIVVTSTF